MSVRTYVCRSQCQGIVWYIRQGGNCRYERHKRTSREPFMDVQALRQTFRPNLGFVHALNVSNTDIQVTDKTKYLLDIRNKTVSMVYSIVTERKRKSLTTLN